MDSNDAPETILQETLDRLGTTSGRQLQSRIGLPDEPGWVTGTALCAEPASFIPGWLDAMEHALGARDRKVVASFFLKAWLRQVVLVSTGGFLLQGRVPDISIDNLGFHVGDDGRVDQIAFLGNDIVTLEDDPAARAEGVRTVANRDELRLALRDMLAWNHVEPLTRALRPFVPVGDRFMWATTADTCVGFILLIGNRLGLDIDYQAEADQLANMEPLNGRTGSMPVEHEGRSIPVLVRGCCCFAYHLDQYGYCKTCPHLPRETRIANTRAEMSAGKS